MTVLILARDFDPTADAVVQALAERDIPVFRTDLQDFPRKLRMHAELCDGSWSGSLWNQHHEVDLAEVRAIWSRNPATYVFPETMTRAEQDLAFREAKLGLGGVLASLDVLWANHPNRCADAIYKPYQWTVAVACGLDVAATAITSDPASAERFARRRPGHTITKALGPTGTADGDMVKVSFTRRLTEHDVADLRGVAVTATTLQEFVPKAFEVRLTVIGDSWFPIAIHAANERAHTDWRSDPSALTYRFVPIPESVVAGVAEYMRHMCLAYAGFDFVVTLAGKWVMLEANTGPQFGWLQAETGAQMVAAMADMLGKGKP
ncbi:MvdC/MvdD family ATP grasp protein [Amycolatopsis sp. cg5]|uniref:MvdC/MvdD family ATP grasp protein n=1 Tax=Amycolatopsis sp. cg5 TaxID=3238802 RepID=UPI0035233E78